MIEMDDKYLAAVDIGGTKMTVSLADKEGIRYKIYQPVNKKGDNKAIPNQANYLIEYSCSKCDISKDSIHSVGVSTCSPFKKKKEYPIVVAPNLCDGLTDKENPQNDWTEIPLEEELSKIYDNVKVGNDCITATIAERLFGNGMGENNLVYVTWSTGIGAGAYVDGHLIKGKNGNALHLGHTYVAEKGPRCGCGNYGDLEVLVSGPSIARQAGYGKNTKKAFDDYRKGRNQKSKEVIENAAKNFARGIASCTAMLDTQVFVLGGSVMKDHDIILPLIKEEFYKSFPALTEGVDIRLTGLGDYLGDMAALSLIMPEEWIEDWQKRKPWEKAPKPNKLN